MEECYLRKASSWVWRNERSSDILKGYNPKNVGLVFQEGWRGWERFIEGVRRGGEVEVDHMLPRLLFLHDNAQDGNCECDC